MVVAHLRDERADFLEMRDARAQQFVAALLDAPEEVFVVLEPLADARDEALLVGVVRTR
jgi:hypothetical protein